MLVECEFVRVEGELREQAVLGEQVVADADRREQIRLPKLFDLARPRKQEEHLGRQGRRPPLPVETLQERILECFLEYQFARETIRESPCQRGLARTDRPLDHNIAGTAGSLLGTARRHNVIPVRQFLKSAVRCRLPADRGRGRAPVSRSRARFHVTATIQNFAKQCPDGER